VLDFQGVNLSVKRLIIVSLSILVTCSAIASWVGIANPIFVLNENQILYLYSTSAQVLSGIYGLTLTGFIFFRNELSREEFEDETLTDAVESLKDRYFKILLFVTVISIFTISMSSIVISAERIELSSLTAIFMNVSQVSFSVNLILIAYFIFDVVAPKRIEKASKHIQEKYDPEYLSEGKGSLEDFLKNYNQLEEILQKYGQPYQIEVVSSDFRPRRRISNVRLAEFIFKSERIDRSLYENIRNLITLRNSIIHGAEPVVSMSIVKQSEKILDDLSEALALKI